MPKSGQAELGINNEAIPLLAEVAESSIPATISSMTVYPHYVLFGIGYLNRNPGSPGADAGMPVPEKPRQTTQPPTEPSAC